MLLVIYCAEPSDTALPVGAPNSVPDWTQELETGLSNQENPAQASSRKHWRLVRCQNGKLSSLVLFILWCTFFVTLTWQIVHDCLRHYSLQGHKGPSKFSFILDYLVKCA